MNNKTPIKIGIVGLGRAGYFMHAAEIKNRSDKFVFHAACDIIPDRIMKFHDEFGAIPYERYEDMLGDPDVELVDIATRSCDHFAHAKSALAAGKDVFLEKPFSMDTREAKELIALGSQRGGPRLFIRHNRRFEHGFELICEIIDSGILGDVYEIKLARNGYQRRNDWQTLKEFGGGLLNNWGTHIIDHALCFCGGGYTSLYSELRLVAAAGDAEDHIKIIFTGQNGRIVDMEVSGGVSVEIPVYTVYGSKGSLVSDGKGFNLRYLDPDKPLAPVKADTATPGFAGHQDPLTWIEERREINFESEGIDRIWDALYDDIRFGKPFPIKLEQAMAVIEVIESVVTAGKNAM